MLSTNQFLDRSTLNPARAMREIAVTIIVNKGMKRNRHHAEIPQEPAYTCDCERASQTELLCQTCRGVSLDDLLSHYNLRHDQKTVFNLQHIVGSNCPFCRFLAACCPADLDITNRDVLSNYRLQVGRVSPIFDTRKIVEAPSMWINTSRSLDGTGRSNTTITSRLILPIHKVPTISGRHVRSDEIDITLIRSWLNTCTELHTPCRTPGNSIHDDIPGMRVIDCQSRLVVPFAPETKEYATLSYVWGLKPVDTTELQDEVLGLLPKVIEDALLVIQRLGIRYLWIDRYCIPQGDAHTKHIQIQNMGSIYGNSMLTIIAAAEGGPYYGLPGVSTRLRTPQPEIRLGRFCLSGYRFPILEIQQSIWNTRAWTYQEAILSKRRLVFTNSQVFFQCLGSHHSDCMTVPTHLLHSKEKVFFEKVDFGKVFPSAIKLRDHQTIIDRIEEYRHRGLSFDRDALDAMAGIFNLYSSLKRPVRFLCGLPIFAKEYFGTSSNNSILLGALSWQAGPHWERRLGFPSWTWVGWKYSQNGLVRQDYVYSFLINTYLWPDATQNITDVVIKAEFADGTILSWDSSYGQILDMAALGNSPSHFRIAGWGFPARIEWRDTYWAYISPPAYHEGSGVHQINIPTPGSSKKRKFDTHDVLVIVTFRSSSWHEFEQLIFEKGKDGNSYERIGWDFGHQALVWNGARRKFIVIEDGKKATLDDLQLEWMEIRVG